LRASPLSYKSLVDFLPALGSSRTYMHMTEIYYTQYRCILSRDFKVVVTHELTDEQKEILERMQNRINYIIKTHKEYLYALSEFDRTGVLKIRGKILYVRKYREQDEYEQVNV